MMMITMMQTEIKSGNTFIPFIKSIQIAERLEASNPATNGRYLIM